MNRTATASSPVWQHPVINGWSLFALVVGPLCLAMVWALAQKDMGSAGGVSAMIAFSVRLSVPWLFLAFAASSIQKLFPSAAGRWLVRNRRYIGLCFAAGMAWQALFILWLLAAHRAYYIEEVYVLRDAIEGVIGYAALAAMTVTSFEFGRRPLTSRQWKWLHTGSIYFLWAYAFSTYWHELYYYPDPDLADYGYYGAALSAWALRLAAWVRQRRRAGAAEVNRAVLAIAGGLVVLAALGAASGGVWVGPAYEELYGFSLARPLERFMPFWPFIPFLPLFVAAAGAALLARRRREGNAA